MVSVSSCRVSNMFCGSRGLGPAGPAAPDTNAAVATRYSCPSCLQVCRPVRLPADRLVSRSTDWSPGRSTQLDRSAYRTAGSSEHRQSHARPLMWARAGSRGSTGDARPRAERGAGEPWPERVTVDGGSRIRCKKLDVPPSGQLAECTIASGQGGGRSGTTGEVC
jgi:hypothetical protein